MAMTQTLAGLITQDPELRGGRPIIAGTGVTVRSVVGYYKLGLTPEETANEMGIDLAGIYAALAYYHLNRESIEADILANSEKVVMKSIHRGRSLQALPYWLEFLSNWREWLSLTVA